VLADELRQNQPIDVDQAIALIEALNMDEVELKYEKMRTRQQHFEQKRRFGYGFPDLKEILIAQICHYDHMKGKLLAKYRTDTAFKEAQGNRKEDLTKGPVLTLNNECQKAHELVLPLFDKIIGSLMAIEKYSLQLAHCQGFEKAANMLALKEMVVSESGVTDQMLKYLIDGMVQIQGLQSLTLDECQIGNLSAPGLVQKV
jgi:hypothetical protein